MDEQREMYEELNALVGSIAKALEISEEETVKALEANQIAIGMETDEEGRNYVGIAFRDKSARIYQGAIKHAPEAAETEAKAEEGCGGGGCSCGH